MVTDVNENNFGGWTTEDNVSLHRSNFEFPEHEPTTQTGMWILLMIAVLFLFIMWAFYLAQGIKNLTSRSLSSADQPTQTPAAAHFVRLQMDEWEIHPDSIMQPSQTFDFVSFGNSDAPPNYLYVGHQESTADAPSERFKCPSVAEEKMLESPPPDYMSLAPF
ncbi:hypothetical protein CDAR_260521 [Caerostris darwini]|uniref:Uncharacterized protein n=1 Tax=Caerostris darwini TaxID=1538125 RepID=A0AAV4NPF0_9ARAC|nr:hypothetical protein CDAR_260521 [Caerostris darwini]